MGVPVAPTRDRSLLKNSAFSASPTRPPLVLGVRQGTLHALANRAERRPASVVHAPHQRVAATGTRLSVTTVAIERVLIAAGLAGEAAIVAQGRAAIVDALRENGAQRSEERRVGKECGWR